MVGELKKFFCKLWKSAVENFVGLKAVYGIKALKNPMCMTGTTNFLPTKNYA
jgi:hypothetical protein